MGKKNKEAEAQLAVFDPPVHEGIVYGRYTFDYQQRNYGISAASIRKTAQRYYQTRQFESALYHNPWFLLSTTAPRILTMEPLYLEKHMSVNAYAAAEIYMITKMALEHKLSKMKTEPKIIELWYSAQEAWAAQCCGRVVMNPETKEFERARCCESDGEFVLYQVTKHLLQKEQDGSEPQKLTPALEKSRTQFVLMMLDSLIYSFTNWVAATEFYLSKLVQILALHTKHGHLLHTGDWKKLENLCAANLGTPEFYEDARNFPFRYTPCGSIVLLDFWLHGNDMDSPRAKYINFLITVRGILKTQIHQGYVLDRAQVDSKKFGDYAKNKEEEQLKKMDLNQETQKQKDQKMAEKEAMTEMFDSGHQEEQQLDTGVSLSETPPPEPLPLTRQTATSVPLGPREQVTGEDKFVDQVQQEETLD